LIAVVETNPRLPNCLKLTAKCFIATDSPPVVLFLSLFQNGTTFSWPFYNLLIIKYNAIGAENAFNGVILAELFQIRTVWEGLMSQEAVERLLGRLLTGDSFRSKAKRSIDTACQEEGYGLNPGELRAISRDYLVRLDMVSHLLNEKSKRDAVLEGVRP